MGLLDAARTGWRWAPTLLEVQEGRPCVFTGVAMRGQLALGLGPRQAWRVAELVRQADLSQAMEKIMRAFTPAS